MSTQARRGFREHLRNRQAKIDFHAPSAVQTVHCGSWFLGRPYDILTTLLLTVLSITVILSYDRYGFPTDEDFGYQRAVNVIEFIASWGGKTEHIARFELINFYGAMPDVLALLAQKLVPALSFDSRHLVSAAFGVGGIYYVYRMGSTFVSPAVGFFAALFLACNPMWFGYMFINIKDIPFAATLFAALYYCLSALTGRCQSIWIWAKAGVAIGLLATTKLVGIVVFGLVGLVTLTFFVAIPNAIRLRFNWVFFGRLLGLAASAIVGCLACFAVFWPQFYFYGPAQLASVIGIFMNHEVWQFSVQINGEYFSYDKIPWYYMSTYWIISMPVFLLALTAAGAVYGSIRREPLIISFVIVCTVFFTYQAITGARVYNGYRHFLFLTPFAMTIAAYPVGHLAESHVSRIVRATALAMVTAGVIATTLSMYRLFPYQYSFYNMLVGDISGADGRFVIDVWRSALRESLRKIEKDMADSNGVIRIYSCGGGSNMNFSAHPRLKRAAKVEEADYVVALRMGCRPDLFEGFPVIAEVRRQGVVFAKTYSLNGPPRL